MSKKELKEKEESKNIHGVAQPLSIQVTKPVLLSGPVLTFIPGLAHSIGGDIHAIVFHQLSYISRDTLVGNDWIKAKRISLTRLQRQTPFVTRRWVIKVVRDLESMGLIRVERTKRVNVYVPQIAVDDLLEQLLDSLPPESFGRFMVSPLLAQRIGLKNAVALQQIHLRNYKQDGSVFFIRSLEEWQSVVFPFWGIATVKRIFRKLRELDLIIVKPYRRKDDGFVNSYRINFIGLAELLGLPIPHVENPFKENPKDTWDNDWKNWTNPVTLQMQKELQKNQPKHDSGINDSLGSIIPSSIKE